MDSTTTVTPVDSSSQQQVTLPDWMTQAGQDAVAAAEHIASTPYQPYTGALTAPLTGNQNAAINAASANQNAGTAAANTAANAANAAAALAARTTNSGVPAATTAGRLYDAAAVSGLRDMNNAQPGYDTAAFNTDELSALANSSTGEGQDLMAMVRRALGLGEDVAAGSVNAGQDALSAAMGYTNASAGALTPSMISYYMSPYITGALDPVANVLRTQAGANNVAIGNKAAMSGAFGGSRQGLLETGNLSALSQHLQELYGQGYQGAYEQAVSAAQNEMARKADAARLMQANAGTASGLSTDAVSRLLQLAGGAGEGARTASGLSTDAANRLAQAAAAGTSEANLAMQIAREKQNLMMVPGSALASLAGTESGLSTDAVGRLLAPVAPAVAAGSAQSNIAAQNLSGLLSTGTIAQANQQQQLDTAYQQWVNQQNYPATQLNALIAALSGTPYGTTTTTQGTQEQLTQNPSMIGQIIGGVAAGAGAAMSDERMKEEIEPAEPEDILAMIRRLPVSTYRYKKEARPIIGDDGRKRIGPMAQDWSREFGGPSNVIPMPQAIGALIAAVQALDARTMKKAA